MSVCSCSLTLTLTLESAFRHGLFSAGPRIERYFGSSINKDVYTSMRTRSMTNISGFLAESRNFRGQETRPHNPIVKYLPSRNADSMSSKESYGAEPARPGGGQQGHQGQLPVSKPTPRHGQSPFHNTVKILSPLNAILDWLIRI